MTDRGIESCPLGPEWRLSRDMLPCPMENWSTGGYGRTVSSKPKQVSWYSVAYNEAVVFFAIMFGFCGVYSVALDLQRNTSTRVLSTSNTPNHRM